MLNASHTHNAPLTLGCCPISHSKRIRTWEREMVATVAECVDRANEGFANVRLSVGHVKLQKLESIAG
jgi:hypothetical protein